MIPCAQWVPQPWLAALVVLGCGASDGPAPPENPPADTTPAQYTLVWSDEFDGMGPPDSTRWGYDVGDGCPGLCGWGNNELQYYTGRPADNARLEDGHLVIEARREPTGSRAHSSARLVTKSKGDWKYGRFEIRARLPSGVGTWPAIWMLPVQWTYGNGSWPDNGEIDIMEHVGFDPDVIHASIHTAAYNHVAGTQKTAKVSVPGARDDFHVYAVEWTPQEIRAFVETTDAPNPPGPLFVARRGRAAHSSNMHSMGFRAGRFL